MELVKRRFILGAIINPNAVLVAVWMMSSLSLGVVHSSTSPPDSVGFCKIIDYNDYADWRKAHPKPAAKTLEELNRGPPRRIRIIYFLPSDRTPREGAVDSIRSRLLRAQEFFADALEAHGHGQRTFSWETDDNGELVVHRVDGQHPDAHYLRSPFYTMYPELELQFDFSVGLYVLVMDSSTGLVGRSAGTAGAWDENRGFALVPYEFRWQTAAHELGHAFGLMHDFRDPSYIMSYGGTERDALSECHAGYLSLNHYFQPDGPMEDTTPPTIQHLSATPYRVQYPAGSKSVPLELSVSDPDGLQQVWMWLKTPSTHRGSGGLELAACLKMNGEEEAIVEFDFDGSIPSTPFSALADKTQHWVIIVAVDGHGNIRKGGRPSIIVEELPPERTGPIPQGLAKLSGDNQQGTIEERLHDPLIVQVTDESGDPLPGVEVTFRVIGHVGRLENRFTVQKVVTDASGQAATWLTLGSSPGRTKVEARAGDLTVTFRLEGIGTIPPFQDGDYPTWHLPQGAMARLGKGALNWRDEGDRLGAFSPDGRLFATQSRAGTWVYDVTTTPPTEFALLPTANEENSSLAFSPDGRILASASSKFEYSPGTWSGDGRIKLWDIASGRTLSDIEGPRAGVVFDNRGRSYRTLEAYRAGVRAVAFSPNGMLLASASSTEDHIRLWDVSTRAHFAYLEGEGVRSLAFSPDGRTLAAAANDRVIYLWDVDSQQILGALEGHLGDIYSVAFSPDGAHIASGAHDRTVQLWDIEEMRNLATLEGHRGTVRSVSFSPDGKSFASGSEDKTIRLWDVESRSQSGLLEGHRSRVRSVTFSPDGRTLASVGTVDGQVRLWDLKTGNAHVFDDYTWDTSAVSFSPDGKLLAMGMGSEWHDGPFGRVELWDVQTARRVAILEGHRKQVYSVGFSPDGRMLASGDDDRMIRLWDLSSGESVATLEGHTDRVGSVAFSPDGTILASGSLDFTLKLWNLETETNTATLRHDQRVRKVVFSPDGTILASASSDQTIKLWNMDAETGLATLDTTLEGHTGPVRCLSFSPDGKTLASGSSDLTVRLWDVATGSNTSILEDVGWQPTLLEFLSDGVTLVWGSQDGTIRLWDTDSGRNLVTLNHGQWSIVGAISNRDILATGGTWTVGVTLLWDLGTLRPYPRDLTKVSGDEQQANPGEPLSDPLSVEVRDQHGKLYPGAVVTFAIVQGQGTLSALSDTTDAQGLASISLILGEEPGPLTITATVSDLGPVTFTATAEATPDFDGDGEVGFADFFLFAEAFGGTDPRFDLDASGTVDFVDFFLFAEHFGQPARAKLMALARERIGLPERPGLQNAPNPFNSQTVISWLQLEPGSARLEVFALTGQRVAVLHEGPAQAGLHRLHWSGRDERGRPLASGVYVYRLVTAGNVQTRKLTLLR